MSARGPELWVPVYVGEQLVAWVGLPLAVEALAALLKAWPRAMLGAAVDQPALYAPAPVASTVVEALYDAADEVYEAAHVTGSEDVYGVPVDELENLRDAARAYRAAADGGAR